MSEGCAPRPVVTGRYAPEQSQIFVSKYPIRATECRPVAHGCIMWRVPAPIALAPRVIRVDNPLTTLSKRNVKVVTQSLARPPDAVIPHGEVAARAKTFDHNDFALEMRATRWGKDGAWRGFTQYAFQP